MSDPSSRVLRFAVTSVLLAGTTGCPDKNSPPPGVIVNPAPPVTSPATPGPSAARSATPAATAATPVKDLEEPVNVNTGPPIEEKPEPAEDIKTNPGPPPK